MVPWGVPWLHPRTGPIEELLTHEENALLFKPGDTRELSHCLDRLMHDEPLRKKLLGKALQEKVRSSCGSITKQKSFWRSLANISMA